jgi:5-methylcytosine-specific restriction endonuclease McrA
MNLDREIERDYKKQAFLRDDGKCRYCELDFLFSLSLFWSYQMDHVIAKSELGADTLENVVTCCASCNGALSRAGHLKTFEDRKNYVLSQIPNRREIYELWKQRLRSPAVVPNDDVGTA